MVGGVWLTCPLEHKVSIALMALDAGRASSRSFGSMGIEVVGSEHTLEEVVQGFQVTRAADRSC